MISKTMQEALNGQLNKEFHSAYIYLGMSAYASSNGFNGCAKWFNTQYQEEMTHGMKLFKYLEEQGADICTYSGISTTPFSSPHPCKTD